MIREPLTRAPLAELARILGAAESLGLDGPTQLVAPFLTEDGAGWADPGAAHQARLLALALIAEIRRQLADLADVIAHQAGATQGPKRVECGSWGMAERVADKGITGWRHDEVIDHLVPRLAAALSLEADDVRTLFAEIPASYSWRRTGLREWGLDADEVAEVKDRGRTIKLTVTNPDQVRVLAEELRQAVTGG